VKSPKPLKPSAEFLQHHTVEEVETAKAGQRRTRVTDQLWIDYYLKHKHITQHQFQAAEQMLALYRAAGGPQKITVSLETLPGPSASDQSERGANALMDYFKLKRIMGTELFGCAQEVVVYDCSAPEWARRHGRNPKAATEIMRMAFDALEDAFKNLRSN
tara:strand:- start:6 stop:485 length:480 start_codon:yes stop_codon:yes gene_type:complete